MSQPQRSPAKDVSPALDPIARQLLESLPASGAVPVDDLPVRWPLIRMHVPVLLDRLAAAGLVQLTPSATPGGAVAITGRGRAALATQSSAGSNRASTPAGLSVRK
jgi:hypothetical protein